MYSNRKKDTKTWHWKNHNLKISHFFICIKGPALPYNLFQSAMATSLDGRGVLLFGGIGCSGIYTDSCHHTDRILELHPGASSWSSLQFTLEHRRSWHNVIPLQWLITISINNPIIFYTCVDNIWCLKL